MNLKNKLDRYYILFLIIVSVILLAGLGSYGLAETSEARYAEISREMLLYGDYLNPKLLGIFHFHKPPITYYITTLGYRIFGINEFGARFFLQVAVILELILVYKMAHLLYNSKRVAFMAGLIYFSLPIVLISSRNLTTDAFLTTFILAAIYCWQLYHAKSKIGFLYFFYILVGLSLLVKGPVALLFIIAYILISKLINKNSWKITRHHVLGFLLCLAIGASWYILVVIENPKLWTYFVEKQLISRINADSFDRSKPFWYYLPIVLGLLLPWWISIIPKFKTFIISLSRKRKESKVLLYSSVVLLVLFSLFSTKMILYILPVFWMLAIFIASELSKMHQNKRGIASICHLILFSLLFIGLIICHFLTPDFITVSYVSLIITLVMFILFLTVFNYLDKSEVYKPAVLAGIFGAALIVTSSSIMANNSSITNSTKEMITYIDKVSKNENKTIIVYDYLLASIPFYSEDDQITIKYSHNTTKRETEFENNESYKEFLWDANDTTVIRKLDTLCLKETSYLLVRNKWKLSGPLEHIDKRFNHHKNYLKWTLYYNK